MLCNKCGAENSDKARYCSDCGAELIENEETDRGNEGLQEYYEAVVGYKNADFYLTRFNRFDSQGAVVSWNWPSFFFSFYWLLYRKMWAWALVYFISPIPLNIFVAVLSPFSEAAVGVVYLLYLAAIFILFPMYANVLYYWNINKKIQKAKNYSTDKDKRLRIIAAEGGTSGAALIIILIFVFVAVIGILAAIAIPAYQDYTIRAKVPEGFGLAEAAKTAVSEYALREQKWPVNNGAAGIDDDVSNNYVHSLKIDKGVIYVEISPDTGTKGVLVFIPSSSGGTIKWSCNESTVAPKYLPANCR